MSADTFRPGFDEPSEIIDLKLDDLEISLYGLEPDTDTAMPPQTEPETPPEATVDGPTDPWSDWEWEITTEPAEQVDDEFDDPNAVPLSVPTPREDGFTFDADEF